MTNLLWSVAEAGEERYLLAATELGLCYINIIKDEQSDLLVLEAWCKRKIDNKMSLRRDDDALKPYARQLQQYWNGERQSFDLPLDPKGTVFQQDVWNELQRIPFGQTVTYQHIAQSLGKSSASRAVGGAIGKNPLLIVVPCHRVIGKDGALTGFSAGLELKVKLLEHEGKG